MSTHFHFWILYWNIFHSRYKSKVSILSIFSEQRRKSFDSIQTKKLEGIGAVIMQQMELRLLREENLQLQNDKQKLYDEFVANKQVPPKEFVTLSFTDIQGSTVLLLY